ncbi:MAG: hypothetical protein OEY11_04415 [Gammaproteobacteria bacterium]|nr:hypothetical protein [Gammaproteobacteria bacterium]
MKNFSVLVLFFAGVVSLFPLSNANAADPVFTFAPPPVAYEGTNGSHRFTYVSADFGTASMTGIGYVESKAINSSSVNSNATAIEDSESFFLMTDGDVTTMINIDTGMRRDYQLGRAAGATFFHGYNWGLGLIDINLETATSHGTSATLTVPLSYTVGIQKKLSLADATIITPYIYGTAGVTFTANNTYSCPDAGGICATSDDQSQFDYTAIVYGFDIFFNGMSLSTVITDSENDMIMFSLGFPMK